MRWTRRHTLLALGGLLALGVAAGPWVWPGRADSVTPANYERVEVGMTLEQVDGVFGRPRTGGRYPGDVCFWGGDGAPPWCGSTRPGG